MATEYSLSYVFVFQKVPHLSCLLHPRSSSDLAPPHICHISGKRTAYICSEKDQKWQKKPQFFTDPFALRYCVAKRYTSDDSFLLASGFTVLVFWNSSVSLLCKRWL